MSEEPKRLLKVSDVARQCQLSIGKVYLAIQSGQLKAARFGSRKALRIEPKEMEKWIKNQQNESSKEPNNLVI